jgi:hypothetical protein
MNNKGIALSTMVGAVIVIVIVLVCLFIFVNPIIAGGKSIVDTITNFAKPKLQDWPSGDYVYHQGVEDKIISDPETLPDYKPVPAACDAPQSAKDSFAKYQSLIKESVDSSGLRDALAGTGYIPEAIVASILTTESNFQPLAVGPCGDAGIAQLQTATARGLGISVPDYGPTITGCKVHPTGCSPCSYCKKGYDYKSVCKFTEDKRFDPDIAIPAAVKYIADRIKDCKQKVTSSKFVAVGVSSYNTGNCKTINQGYIDVVLGKRYSKWAGCLSQMGYSAT